jgi:hypothetical protein
MKIKSQPLLSILTALIAIYAMFMGTQSYYGLALLGILFLFILVSALFGLLFIVMRYVLSMPKVKAVFFSLNIAEVLFAGILLSHVIGHHVSRYKPTRTFYIPDDFVGCIYLFETSEELHSDTISKNGIGYIHWDADYVMRLERNGLDVTDAWNLAQTREGIHFYHEDSTILESIPVSCTLINDSNVYEPFSVYSTVLPKGMHPSTYTEMVKWGWIDDDRVLRWKQKRLNKLTNFSVVVGRYVGDEKVD